VRFNYLASPPLVVAYALAGTMDFDPKRRADWQGQRRQVGLPARYLADRGGSERGDCKLGRLGDVPRGLCARVRGRRRMAKSQDSRGRPFPLEEKSSYVKAPPFFRWRRAGAHAAQGYQRGACAGGARRQRHDRPYFAGRIDCRRRTRGKYLIAQGVQPQRLQFLRRAPRQS